MGTKKDLNRVKELIFGKDLERFETKFDLFEQMIENMSKNQKTFEKRIEKEMKNLEIHLDALQQKSSLVEKKLEDNKRQQHSVSEKMERQIQRDRIQTSDQLKTLKTELKMYMKAKLNSIDTAKISHKELSDMFATLSKDLQEEDTNYKHAR